MRRSSTNLSRESLSQCMMIKRNKEQCLKTHQFKRLAIKRVPSDKVSSRVHTVKEVLLSKDF